jgi:RNAse (barnase) inhibitor barstar
MNLHEALDARAGGVYRFKVTATGLPVPSAADRQVVRIGVKNARDKLAFLKPVAEALQFPDYFGQNWDAFYDCLTDLAQRGRGALVILLDDASGFARAEPEEFGAAVDALRDAAEYWDATERRLVVLVGIGEPLLATELAEVSVR